MTILLFVERARIKENASHDMFCVGLVHSYKYSLWMSTCSWTVITVPLLIVSVTCLVVTINQSFVPDLCDPISHIRPGPDKDLMAVFVCWYGILAGVEADGWGRTAL